MARALPSRCLSTSEIRQNDGQKMIDNARPVKCSIKNTFPPWSSNGSLLNCAIPQRSPKGLTPPPPTCRGSLSGFSHSQICCSVTVSQLPALPNAHGRGRGRSASCQQQGRCTEGPQAVQCLHDAHCCHPRLGHCPHDHAHIHTHGRVRVGEGGGGPGDGGQGGPLMPENNSVMYASTKKMCTCDAEGNRTPHTAFTQTLASGNRRHTNFHPLNEKVAHYRRRLAVNHR